MQRVTMSELVLIDVSFQSTCMLYISSLNKQCF